MPTIIKGQPTSAEIRKRLEGRKATRCAFLLARQGLAGRMGGA